MEDEDKILISAKSNGPHEAYKYVNGSVEMPCVKCGDDVWVSPYGQGVIAKHPDNVQVMCTDCSFISADPDDIKIAELTDEQRAELHSKGLTDKDIDIVKRFFERKLKGKT